MEKPLFNLHAFIGGFLSGGLISAFFVFQAAFLLKFIVLIFGFLVLLDFVLPAKEEQDYPLLVLIGFAMGFIVAIILSVVKIEAYFIIIILITLITYIVKLAKRLGLLE